MEKRVNETPKKLGFQKSDRASAKLITAAEHC